MGALRVSVALIAVLAVGCGDSGGGDAAGSGGAAGTFDNSATGGASGRGATGGMSGAGATGGGAASGTGGGAAQDAATALPEVDAGPGVPTRVVCGGIGGFICTETAETMGRTLGPCCDEDSGFICGVGVPGACEGLYQEGEITDACPGENDVLGRPLPGCCRPDGACGLWISDPAFGCVERSDVVEIGVGPFDAQGCTAVAPVDAGT